MNPDNPAPAARPRAVVTGASSGLGLAFTRALARRGYDLVVAARDADALGRLADEVRRAHGVSVQVVPVDLAHPEGPDLLADAVLAGGGAPSLLVNNAGAGYYGPWLEADAGEERELLRLNIEAPTRLARRLLPAIAGAGGGRLLNVASVGAFVPGPRMAAYYAAKAYLLSWSLALAEEFRAEGGPTVTCLCPGPMRTGFQGRAGFRLPPAGAAAGDPERVAEAGIEGALAGRPLVVPGPRNRLVALAARVLPRPWMARLVHRMQRGRRLDG